MTSTELQTPGYVVGTWTVDPVHSYIGFVIKHLMVAKVRGRFTSFTGEITTAPNLLDSAVTASIDVTSVDTTNSTRDDHIRSADFFDAEHHRAMTFASSGIRHDGGRYYIDGDQAGFSATAEIDRTDFGVSYNGPIPGGGMTLGERIQIVLEIEADLNT